MLRVVFLGKCIILSKNNRPRFIDKNRLFLRREKRKPSMNIISVISFDFPTEIYFVTEHIRKNDFKIRLR